MARQYFNTLQANWTGMCVIRIDLNDWVNALQHLPCAATSHELMIDMSDKKKQSAFFRTSGPREFAGNQEDLTKLNKAETDNEVRLMWRGHVPISAMQVVDDYTGAVKRPFSAYLEQSHLGRCRDTGVHNNKIWHQYTEMFAFTTVTTQSADFFKAAHDAMWSEVLRNECPSNSQAPFPPSLLSSPSLLSLLS